KYGARVALFGRKINNAEQHLAFIEMLRLITDGKVSPEEAVRAYHGVLQGKGIKPHRPLDDDLKLTDQAMSYDGSAGRRAMVTTQKPMTNDESRMTKEIRNPKSEIRSDDWPKRT